jgi:REP element-mobilizing transposase RayT
MRVTIKPFDHADPLTIRQRRLPHWRQDGCAYSLTCHLGDSLPTHILQLWSGVRGHWLDLHPPPWTDAEASEYHERFTEQMERHLDAGCGSCVLRRPECAQAVVDTLAHGDGAQYDLGTFVVMPNHVHLLVVPRPGHDLSDLTHAWERISAHRINRALGRRGSLWSEDAYDHIVRDQAELERTDAYVRQNPEKAGLQQGMFVLGGSTEGWVFLPSNGLARQEKPS